MHSYLDIKENYSKMIRVTIFSILHLLAKLISTLFHGLQPLQLLREPWVLLFATGMPYQCNILLLLAFPQAGNSECTCSAGFLGLFCCYLGFGFTCFVFQKRVLSLHTFPKLYYRNSTRQVLTQIGSTEYCTRYSLILFTECVCS